MGSAWLFWLDNIPSMLYNIKQTTATVLKPHTGTEFNITYSL